MTKRRSPKENPARRNRVATIKIICLDQSTQATGYSVWVNGTLKEHGAFTLDASKDEDVYERSVRMTELIEPLVKKYKPDCVVVEDTQFQRNVKTLKNLSQLQGEIFYMVHKAKSAVIVVEPSVWKSFVGIKARKRAEQKLETIAFVKEKYKVDNPTEDEADAIAIGCWAVNNLKRERN